MMAIEMPFMPRREIGGLSTLSDVFEDAKKKRKEHITNQIAVGGLAQHAKDKVIKGEIPTEPDPLQGDPAFSENEAEALRRLGGPEPRVESAPGELGDPEELTPPVAMTPIHRTGQTEAGQMDVPVSAPADPLAPTESGKSGLTVDMSRLLMTAIAGMLGGQTGGLRGAEGAVSGAIEGFEKGDKRALEESKIQSAKQEKEASREAQERRFKEQMGLGERKLQEQVKSREQRQAQSVADKARDRTFKEARIMQAAQGLNLSQQRFNLALRGEQRAERKEQKDVAAIDNRIFKEVGSINQGLGSLGEVLKAAEKQPKLGFFKGTVESIKGKVGAQDPVFTEFFVNARINVKKAIKDFSGTAASEKETKYIESFNPTEKDGKLQIRAKVNALITYGRTRKKLVMAGFDPKFASDRAIEISERLQADPLAFTKMRELSDDQIQALAWARNNPDNPKSEEIFELMGVK